jgi:sugar/nucleoside kinase (ribokinase family)
MALARADILLPSGDELFAAAPAATEAEAVQKLLDDGIGEVVLKRGAAGATVFTKDGRTDAAGFAVEEIDPTGAGDCFGGAYIACRRLGLPVEEALNYANAAGALAVTARGPMEGAATRAALDAFIADAGRR